MVMEKSLYSQLAGLLEYPQEDIKIKVEECLRSLASHDEYGPETAEALKAFQTELDEITLDDLQGIFSYTFELTSDFTLDMGYHVYDGFKRASNLSAIKTMYIDQGFPFEEFGGGELPDHLPLMLHFLGFLKDPSLRANFRETFVIMALEKLKQNMDKSVDNIYRHIITTVYRVLEKDVKEGK